MTENGPAVSYKDSKSTQSEVDKETTPSEKKVATTKSSLDVKVRIGPTYTTYFANEL
jgi:hypothetical protein